MKIHLCGAYNLADGYLGAAKALEGLGHTISFSPMMRYSNESRKTHLERVIADIKAASPDVILWWRAETLLPEELAHVRANVDGLFAMYCWDPMTVWEEGEARLGAKCKSWELAITCCKPSMAMYEKYGCKAVYAPPGFDPVVHFPEPATEYECDVSMVLTNLYHGNAITKVPHVSRKLLLQSIILLAPELKVKVYGPDWLKSIFPKNYAGWVAFNDSHKVFYNSRINLCTHLRPDTDMYYNERVAQVLGSGGLLFVDYVAGLEKILDIGKECLVMDFSSPQKIAAQVKVISDPKNSFRLDAIRKAGHEKALKALTWGRWAEIVDAALGMALSNK